MNTKHVNERVTEVMQPYQPVRPRRPTRTGWPIVTCLLLLLGCLGPAAAATHVCGLVFGTWTAANSPYILDCNVQAANLTIQPGVTVSASNYTFEVDGVLTAIGTAAQPIVFNACNPAVGWQGIWFNASSPGSEMSYCIISNAVNSGVQILNSTPSFDHCAIVNNSSASGSGGGVSASIAAGDLGLTNCTIANNSAAGNGGGIQVSLSSTNTLVLECCVIQGNVANPSGNSGNLLRRRGLRGALAACRS